MSGLVKHVENSVPEDPFLKIERMCGCFEMIFYSDAARRTLPDRFGQRSLLDRRSRLHRYECRIDSVLKKEIERVTKQPRQGLPIADLIEF